MSKQESKLEDYFTWYLEELEAAGYVTEWTPQPRSYLLADKATYVWEKQLKTKIKDVEAMIPELSEHIYTPDFEIVWAKKARDVFHTNLYSGKKALVDCPFISDFEIKPLEDVSLIEIKPPKDRYNMIRVFGLNQRWMWQRHGIYVQKVVPDWLFKDSFVPERYLFCDVRTSQRRTIHYPVRSLEQYQGRFAQ